MRKFLALGFFIAAMTSCTVDELPTNQNADDIDKDKYEIPPNGITDDKDPQGIDKDNYEIPPNG
ncbi:hypothetical protein [Zunongwangia profunda]|uniref:hypothetical protein n=1 Tax=Zunongwangia profunda TaxID=398743 RepID=UPI0023A8AFE6|nr:hypothetical protein [Zunongwangia profunda]|tara:strand:+ start:433 stop:624 length:192 start_codon:yes stop_codon:yes gene_type:complete